MPSNVLMYLAYFANQIRKRTPYVEHVFKAFYALHVTTNVERPNGCLPPVAIDHVVDEPDLIRDIARNNGPYFCLLYTSPSPRDVEESRMPSSA